MNKLMERMAHESHDAKLLRFYRNGACTMTCKNLYEELVEDCRLKLGRELTPEEDDFVKWMEQQQTEALYKNVKTS